MNWKQYVSLSIAILSAFADGRPQEKVSCKDGETWMDDCNNCWCDKGQPACTLMACLPKPRNTRDTIDDLLGPSTCKDGDRWKEDCNDCWCDNGRPACTLKGCFTNLESLDRETRSTVQAGGPTCKEGDTWKDECNTCVCDNGHPACTQKACIPQAPSPGRKTRSTDCNCDLFGSLRPTCDEGGQCECRPYFGGLTCDRCLAGFHLGPDGCQDCDCDPFGSLRPICDEGGQCECRPYYGGLRCDRCLAGFHLGPDGCQEQCVPLTAWKKGHVVCTCSHDGVELCEHELNRSKRDTTIEEVLKYYVELHKDCTEGTVWKSNCADCKCTDAGPHCTAVPDCTPGPITPKKTSCEEGERWMDECNNCWCEQSRAVCTRKGCEGYPHYQVALPPDQQHHVDKREAQDSGCTPGKVWIQMTDNDEGCAKFTCQADGTATSVPHFTREMCPSHPQYIDEDGQHSVTKRGAGCKAGDKWMEDCNECTCNEEGKGSCTRKLCEKDHSEEIPWLLDQEQKQQHKVARRETSCTPGKIWIQMTEKEGCAKFTCQADGSVTSAPHFSRELCPVPPHKKYLNHDGPQKEFAKRDLSSRPQYVDQDGQHSITKRETGCTPGKVWIQMTDNDEGCAKFTCQADGTATSVPHFTREKCPSHPQYIDEDGQYITK